MSKEVVYILGAGFSAPTGIPTMKTFIDRARQMKRGNRQYDYFDRVIKLINETIFAGQYFAHDPGNIEQALSLIEMKENLESTNSKNDLIRFVVDVIKGSTPTIPQFEIDKMPSHGWEYVFTPDQNWQGYCGFVASLANLEFREGTDYQLRGLRVQLTEGKTNYSLISLNYDLLLENVASFFSRSYWWGQKALVSFKRGATHNGELLPYLLKLHGSVDANNIIPPTYNKGLYGSELPQSWRDAFQLLHRANEIRVIGYSLPDTCIGPN